VTSLYQVPDAATQEMIDFYSRLADDAGKLDALRGAQLQVIKKRRTDHGAAHPFFWACFILVGQPD